MKWAMEKNEGIEEWGDINTSEKGLSKSSEKANLDWDQVDKRQQTRPAEAHSRQERSKCKCPAREVSGALTGSRWRQAELARMKVAASGVES